MTPRDVAREWIERWAVTGPILDDDRWARLLSNSSDQLRQQAVDLLALWQPDVAGDDGAALIVQQRVFRRLNSVG